MRSPTEVFYRGEVGEVSQRRQPQVREYEPDTIITDWPGTKVGEGDTKATSGRQSSHNKLIWDKYGHKEKFRVVSEEEMSSQESGIDPWP